MLSSRVIDWSTCSSIRNWRAENNEDGHYSYAIAT
jgi:hypothetical protein